MTDETETENENEKGKSKMGLADTQKTADHNRVTQRGNWFNHDGEHLATIEEIKSFNSKKNGVARCAVVWKLEATDNPAAKDLVGKKFTWLGNLDRKWSGGDGDPTYPDRDRLQQLMVAICNGDPKGIQDDEGEYTSIEDLYEMVDNDPTVLAGASVKIKTTLIDTENTTDFTVYEFYAAS